MLDAPVSGGVPAAENATLTFIVGGPEEGMDRARPLLLSMGAQAVYCGEAGAGCIAKVRFIVGGTVEEMSCDRTLFKHHGRSLIVVRSQPQEGISLVVFYLRDGSTAPIGR